MWRFYIEVARTTYRRQLVYRWANLAGICTNTFFSIIMSSILIALYQGRSVASGFSLRDALSYTWTSQALIMVVLPFGWVDLMLTIRTGEVVTDLNKPCDFFLYWCSRELGRAVYYFFFRALPIYLVGVLLYGLGFEGGWQVVPVFLLCLVMGIVTGVVFRVLLNLAAFWILETRALVSFGITIAQFFTGSYLPVVFFPSWLSFLSAILPFSGMINAPNQVLLGKLAGLSLLGEMALQLAWLLLLIFVVRFITAVATRRVVIQGG